MIYDAQQRSDGRSALSSLQSQSTFGSKKVCDSGQDSSVYTQSCIVPTKAANSKIDDANLRDAFGWGAVGLGAAGVVLGAVLFVTADDPHRYDHDEADAPRARVVPTFWTTRGGGGAALTGTF